VHSKPKLGPCFFTWMALCTNNKTWISTIQKHVFFQQCWHLIDREGSIFDADKFSPGSFCGLVKIWKLAARKV
jgi:hypothetical protein